MADLFETTFSVPPGPGGTVVDVGDQVVAFNGILGSNDPAAVVISVSADEDPTRSPF